MEFNSGFKGLILHSSESPVDSVTE